MRSLDDIREEYEFLEGDERYRRRPQQPGF